MNKNVFTNTAERLNSKKTLQLHFLFAMVTFPEAVFLVMCDPSMNKL